MIVDMIAIKMPYLKDDTHKDKVRRLFEVLLTTTITPNRDEARCAKEVLLSHLEPRTDDKADIILNK
jgi:hypothetical protein